VVRLLSHPVKYFDRIWYLIVYVPVDNCVIDFIAELFYIPLYRCDARFARVKIERLDYFFGFIVQRRTGAAFAPRVLRRKPRQSVAFVFGKPVLVKV
jgi:hypothetical protein